MVAEELRLQISNLTIRGLLECYSFVVDALDGRGVIRSKNVIGDYAEWLVSRRLDLQLETRSKAGYDALGNKSIRYQIKARHQTAKNRSTQLSAFRHLEKGQFDYLIGVLFKEDFTPRLVVRMPYAAVLHYASRKNSVEHVLRLQGPCLMDPRTVDITKLFTEV